MNYSTRCRNENKELQDTVANEKAMQINYSYADIRKWLSHFRTLDYSKIKNRKDLIDIFIYKVILYDDKMKVLFHLKNGQKNELLLNLIFPDYPDGHGNTDENGAKEKETDKSVSFSSGCSYTPVMVHLQGACAFGAKLCASLRARTDIRNISGRGCKLRLRMWFSLKHTKIKTRKGDRESTETPEGVPSVERRGHCPLARTLRVQFQKTYTNKEHR